MRAPVPPGWPREIWPPQEAGWEGTAVKWLLDQVPAEWRLVPVFRRPPQVLAWLTRAAMASGVTSSVTIFMRVASFPEPDGCVPPDFRYAEQTVTGAAWKAGIVAALLTPTGRSRTDSARASGWPVGPGLSW